MLAVSWAAFLSFEASVVIVSLREGLDGEDDVLVEDQNFGHGMLGVAAHEAQDSVRIMISLQGRS